MKFSGLVLCSDVDGTLINEKNEVPKENLEAIEYFRSHGGKFMLATGRIPQAVLPIINGFTVDFPCICNNGCGVYDLTAKKYIDITPLEKGAIEAAEHIAKISPRSGIEIMSTDGICVVKPTYATDRHIEYEKIEVTTADGFVNAPKVWLKVLYAQEPNETEYIKKELENSPYHQKYNMLKTHRFYYELFNKNASKGEALKKFCKTHNIDLKNVIAIGDNENDISMLDAAGRSAAVANAPDEVKAHAHIVVCSNDQGAVADLISRL